MNSFPAYLKLAGRIVVIAGGGEEALRKARLYAAAGADLRVIAETIDAAFHAPEAPAARLIARALLPEDFEGALVAVVADAANDAEARRLADLARKAGALVNVVDKPALCDFSTPAIIDRGDVVIAVGTGGAAPVLGQRLRAKIEAMAPPRLKELAAFARSFRGAVKATRDASERRAFWARIFDGPIAARFLAGDEAGAREAMLAALNGPSSQAGARCGVVHIVGAGPGDPELLTLKAHRLLADADVIVHDRLVSNEILALARRDADRIYVGKAKSNHAVAQAEIAALLVEHARAGKTVVRLKGGDPFMFGRGGEEIDALRAAGVPAFVVPGVTAAAGCAASVGMALTHRDHARAVTFATGHAQARAKAGAHAGAKSGNNSSETPDLNWAALAALGHTLVFYMGVSTAGEIMRALLVNGADATTPVAVIENGSRPEQRLLKGRLSGLEDLIVAGGVAGPALLVIGDVAALADDALCETVLTHPDFLERKRA